MQGQAPAIYCGQHRRRKQVQTPIQIKSENGTSFDLIDEPSFCSLRMKAYIEKEKKSISLGKSFAERKVMANHLLTICSCHIEDCPSKDNLVKPNSLKVSRGFTPPKDQRSCFQCASTLSPVWWPERDNHLCHKCAFSQEGRKLNLFLL